MSVISIKKIERTKMVLCLQWRNKGVGRWDDAMPIAPLPLSKLSTLKDRKEILRMVSYTRLAGRLL